MLLSDVGLPGLSGIELAREARARHPQLQVVLATGYGRAQLPTPEGEPRTQLLPKPYSVEELEAVLDRIAPAARQERGRPPA